MPSKKTAQPKTTPAKPRMRKHTWKGVAFEVPAALHGAELSAAVDAERARIDAELDTPDLADVLAESIARTKAEAEAAVAIAAAAGTEPNMVDPAAAEEAAIEIAAQTLSDEVEVELTAQEAGVAAAALGRHAYRAFDSWGDKLAFVSEQVPVRLTRKQADTIVAALADQLAKIKTAKGYPAEGRFTQHAVLVDNVRARINAASVPAAV